MIEKLIIVTGDVEFSGGGGNDRYIEGAVIAGGNVRVDGNPDIYFDCGMVLDFWKSTSKFHTMWWREIKGRL